jgi:tRNA pseudouridine38-40 synthase
MRYFAEISYDGTAYHGWQRQPGQKTVQSVLEGALGVLLGTETELTGCGRTDAGVHARQYFFHFDTSEALPSGLLGRLNRYLPSDIAFHRLMPVQPHAHARFDAVRRSYAYHLRFDKNPFDHRGVWQYPFARQPDFSLVSRAAAMLLAYDRFGPFCKTHHDARTMTCELTRSEWEHCPDGRWVYHVSANRFLRGMVRLMVGMCLNAGTGKVSLAEVQDAMDRQAPMPSSWSVPPQGLYLTEVSYGARPPWQLPAGAFP